MELGTEDSWKFKNIISIEHSHIYPGHIVKRLHIILHRHFYINFLFLLFISFIELYNFIVALFTVGRQCNPLTCLEIYKWRMKHGIFNAILFCYTEIGSYYRDQEKEQKRCWGRSEPYDIYDEKAKSKCFI